MHTYVFVRKDLDWPQVAVQAGHACLELGRQFFNPYDLHPNLVLIGIKSEAKLKSVESLLMEQGVRYAKFHDKKLDQDTSIATEPVSEPRRAIFSKYRLLTEETK